MVREHLHKVWLRLKAVVKRRQLDRDLAEELEFHLAMREQKLIEQGMPPREARYAARRGFGNVVSLKETSRDLWSFPSLESLLQDVRYGLRQLRRNPGFTAVAVLTLALGIGATTAIFSVIYGGLLNPWPFKDSDRLGVLMLHDTALDQDNWALVSAPEWLDFKEQNHVFSEVLGGTFENGVLTGSGAAEQYFGRRVTTNGNRVFGVTPFLGRDFTNEDAKPGAPPVVMLSYKFWQRKFGGDPAIVGKTIVLNHQPTTVIGVEAKRLSGDDDLFLPASLSRARGPGQNPYYFFGRLKPGVSFEQAAADIAILANRFAPLYASDHPKGVIFTVKSFSAAFAVPRRRPWEILFGAVGLLLLIACVNVANLLLARATTRQRETALRAALGASRGRLVRQFLVESLILATGGAALGCLLAWNVLGGLLAIIPGYMLPNEAEIRINGVVLVFTLGAALLSTLLFGLTPALLAASRDPQEHLKAASRGAGENPGQSRMRNLLVVSEVALSLVLLTGGGMVIRNFLAARHAELGYDYHDVLGANYHLPELHYKTPEQRSQFNLETLRRIRALPGVLSATLSWPPMDWDQEYPIEIVGKPSAEKQIVWVRYSGDRFFETVGIPFLRGRTFSEDDLQHARRVAVVNRALVSKYFAGENPLGRQVTVVLEDMYGTNAGRQEGFEIIGVVADTKPNGTVPTFRPGIFLNFTDRAAPDTGWAEILMRFKGNAPGLTNSVRAVFTEMDKELPVDIGWTLQNRLDRQFTEPRLVLTMLVAFASLGLVLVSVGVYSVLSYAVSRRTHEIGIRMALGAEATNVRLMVLNGGLRWLLVGIGIGVPASVALARILQNRIWGIKSADPLTLVVVSLVLTAVGLAACYFPARRATKVDPMVALRCE
jgi:putative ABC transport system permease protein